MANVRNSNTFYIDTAAADSSPSTTGNLALKNVKVLYIKASATGSTPRYVLNDVTTGAIKFDVNLENGTEPIFSDFSRRPVVFPNGIYPSTITNCKLTLVIEESGA